MMDIKDLADKITSENCCLCCNYDTVTCDGECTDNVYLWLLDKRDNLSDVDLITDQYIRLRQEINNLEDQLNEIKLKRCNNCKYYIRRSLLNYTGCSSYSKQLTAPPELMSCIRWEKQ